MIRVESEHRTTSSQEQGEWHYVVTVQKPMERGIAVQTSHGTATFSEDDSRADAYAWVLEQMYRHRPEMRGGNVLFFSLEPNHL